MRLRNSLIALLLTLAPALAYAAGSENEVFEGASYNSKNGYSIMGTSVLAIYPTSATQFTLVAPVGLNLALKTTSDSKPILLNSRDYLDSTSTNNIGFQSKPSQAVITTGTITGGEIFPNCASGIACANAIGLAVGPILKGAAGGDVSGEYRGVDVRMSSDVGSTRTVTGDVMGIKVRNAFHSTVTGDVEVLNVTDDGGTTAFELFGKFPAVASVFVAPGNTTAIGDAGYLKIKIGGTAYRLIVMEDE